jgi:carboxypeptidase Q
MSYLKSTYLCFLILSLSMINTFEQSGDKYTDLVKFINTTISTDPNYKHYAWNTTAWFVDSFGPRLWGSKNLEASIFFLRDLLINEGFQNVRLDEYQMARNWVRGNEKMTMISPRPFPCNIPMIGLGNSVGGDIFGQIVEIRSWEELEEKKDEIKGKIVFYNQKWAGYPRTVEYRTKGASKAAMYGAIASVVRSIAPVSSETPHAGTMHYDEAYPKIPAMAVSLETADMWSRMLERGEKVTLEIHMDAHYEEGSKTRNVIGELIGNEYPDEIVLMGGHIDSWDVGPQTGANDDAGGFMTCFAAIRFLIKNNLKPKRTLRFIAWSGEEFGEPIRGATNYPLVHEMEMGKHVVAFENDLGTNDLIGWGFTGSDNAFTIVGLLAQGYLNDINAGMVQKGEGDGPDTQNLYDQYKIPMMRNINKDTPDNEYYFRYHHTAADSMNIINPDFMDRNVIGTAAMFYLIADLPEPLPRD